MWRKVDPARWIPNRFFRFRDFPYSKFEIRDFKANSELKVCAGGWIAKISLGITGLREIVSGLRNWRTPMGTLRFVQNTYVLLSGSSPFSLLGISFNFFHLTGLQNSRLFFFLLKISFQDSKSRLKIFARRRPFFRSLARSSWPKRKLAECLNLMPDSSDPSRCVWNSRHETQTQGDPLKNENSLNK